MTVTPAEQRAWQLRAAAVLTDLLKRAADEDLPVLLWSVDHAGVGVIGRAVSGPPADRRAAVRAWCTALGIEYAEHHWPSGGSAIRCRTPDGYTTARGFCRIVLTADVQAGEEGEDTDDLS